MPTLKVSDITMYYEVHGQGEPLVLIPGLRTDVSEYIRIIDGLSDKYRVIALDNRGAGRTDKPDMPYTIDMMAGDAAGLLDGLGIKRAHILGVSMGGRIAAALTLARPDLVRSLILVSTSMARQPRLTLGGRLFNWAVVTFNLGARSPYPQPYYALLRQREASRSYDCMDRLGEIGAPTLILHGRRDRLAPYRLAQAMHDGIKGSEMIAFDGGHLFLFFRPAQFRNSVRDFLAALPAA